MSIKRINQFPEGSGTLTSDDVFLIMDNPSGSGQTKRVSLSTLSSVLGGGGSGGGGSTAVVSLSYSSTINTNASSGNIFDITLTGNATLANPTNPVNGQTIRWRIRQDDTGGRTVAFGDNFVFQTTPTLGTGSGALNVIEATYFAATGHWVASLVASVVLPETLYFFQESDYLGIYLWGNAANWFFKVNGNYVPAGRIPSSIDHAVIEETVYVGAGTEYMLQRSVARLTVNGDADLNVNEGDGQTTLTVSGTATFNDTSRLLSHPTFPSAIAVGSAVFNDYASLASGNLSVSGSATFNDYSSVASGVLLLPPPTSTVTFNGNATFAGYLVGAASVFNGNSFAMNGATLESTATFNDAAGHAGVQAGSMALTIVCNTTGPCTPGYIWGGF